MSHVAIVGGGVCGLTAAIRLSQRGVQVDLWEASTRPGGRASSYFEQKTQSWVDPGPHLITGAYQATLALLSEAGAESNVYFQPSLSLPLWDKRRGHFRLEPPAWLPLPIALPLSLGRMPDHGIESVMGMLRLAANLGSAADEQINVRDWLASLQIPDLLRRDLLETICLGAMNESMDTADAASFSRILRDSFKNHDTARLGWFRLPLRQALIDPLMNLAGKLGTRMRFGCPARNVTTTNNMVEIMGRVGNRHRYDQLILALPPWHRDRLLKLRHAYETRAIVNAHFWFEDDIQLPSQLVGTLGTSAHWWFDIDAMHGNKCGNLRHLCAVISADENNVTWQQRSDILLHELSEMLGEAQVPLKPVYSRMIIDRRATALVRPNIPLQADSLPSQIIDAGETPAPGQLPATIEAAVRRGEASAYTALGSDSVTDYPL